MRAGPKTASGSIVAPFPNEKIAIIKPEAGLGPEGTDIKQGGFNHILRKIAFAKCIYKFNGPVLQAR
jgi:hypothetical protein